jgi:hypothetical protein
MRVHGFILVPAAGPYVHQVELVRYIAMHRGACRGGYMLGGRGGKAYRSLLDD